MDARLVLALWTIAALAIAWVCARLRNTPLLTVDGVEPPTLTLRLGQLAWAVGLPCAALISGGVSRDVLGMGSASPSLFAGFSPAQWLTGGSVAVVVVLVGMGVSAGILGRPDAPGASFTTIRPGNALAEGARWAWNRALPTLVSGSLPAGALVGLGINVLDWLIPRDSRAQLMGPSRHRAALTFVRALCNAIVFLQTGNGWLALGVQLALAMAVPRLQSFAWQRDPSSS